jgi:sigma54-dependent transcription regulator
MISKSKEAELIERRKQVAKLYLNRAKIADIADKLGIDYSTVSRDITYLKKCWLEESKEDISKQIARELAELDLMELEANIQYQAAKKAGKDVFMIRWKETQLKIKDRRAKLLGLDRPQKVELDAKLDHSGKLEVKKMSDEELQKEIENELRNLNSTK